MPILSLFQNDRFCSFTHLSLFLDLLATTHCYLSGMGRVKLEIKKLENSSRHQTTYSKRKNGILKKAHELSVLCDIDLVLIMFSPGGKPSFCIGKHSIEEVIAKFNHLPPHERTKRKLEGLEALRKTFKKLDHDVNVEDLLGTSTPTVKDLRDQAAAIQRRLAQIHERLGYWTNPNSINNLEILSEMEDSLQSSLEQIQQQKENFQKRQRVTLKSSNEIPFRVIDEQQLPLLWTTNDDIEHGILTEEPIFGPQRGMESCTGSTSGSYFGCLSTGSKSEANSPGQLSGTNSIGQNAFQGLQYGGQYPYLPQNLHMHGGNNLQAAPGVDQQQSIATYNVGAYYQPTEPQHDICNPLPPNAHADSVLGDYFNYQKLAAPTTSIYERVAQDPSHIMFDNSTMNPFG